MDVRIASRVAAWKNRLEYRFARRVGYADGAQIGSVGNIVDRVTSERVTLPDVDRVACQRLAASPSLHERNREIEGLALGRDRRIADVGAHFAPHDAALSRTLASLPCALFDPSPGNGPSVSFGSRRHLRVSEALAIASARAVENIRAFAESRKLTDRAHRREQGQDPAAIEESAEVVLKAEIVIVWRSFASDHRNLCQGRPLAIKYEKSGGLETSAPSRPHGPLTGRGWCGSKAG